MPWLHRWGRVVPWAAAGAALALAGLAIWLLFDLPGAAGLSNVLFVATSALGAVGCGRAAVRTEGRARIGWGLAAAGAGCWTGGNLMWAWYGLVLSEPVPTPSGADLFFIAGYVLLAVGVLTSLLPHLSRAGGFRLLVDATLVVCSAVFIVWAVALGDVAERHDVALVRYVTWLYPALDLVAAAFALAVMSRVSPTQRLPWLGLAAGVILVTTGDTVWATTNLDGNFAVGTLVDLFWIAGYSVIGLGGLLVGPTPGPLALRRTGSRLEPLVPYAALAVALLVAFVENLGDGLAPELLTAGMLAVAVLLLRQVLSVLENHDLATDLEQRVAQRTAELRESEEHFRSIVQSISDVVLIVDDQACIRYQSPSVTRALGYEPDELVGRFGTEITHPDDTARCRAAVRAVLFDGSGGEQCEARVLRRDGSWGEMEVTVNPFDLGASSREMVMTMRDVDERKELERRLRHQAFHDTLTGLLNRASLYEGLDDFLRADRHPSLVLVDLDEFKAINDTAGHELGDEVLVAVAARIASCTRPEDLVSRLGGDEFAVAVADDPEGVAAQGMANRLLESLRRPLVVRGHDVRCLGSIGIATVPVGGTVADVLRDADVAMYAAKARGKGRAEVFTSEMHDSVMKRRQLEDLLRSAVAECRLLLRYQPIVDLTDGAVVGVEALLRLRGLNGEIVFPQEFIPVAEETGLIVGIGGWVLTEACVQAAAWQSLRPDGPLLELSVNVSTRQLQDPGLPEAVSSALRCSGFPPSLLTLEITEGALASADVGAALARLRTLGVRLSIDDFGTGYSSLGRLRHLAVDELKIDQSFVAELDGSGDAPLVDAVLAMATRLGLAVVAEGIETTTQADYLVTRGCARGQGFLYHHPLPPDGVAALLAPDLMVKDSTSVGDAL